MTGRTKILLDESELPRQWYNIVPDLPSPPPPPLHPGTLQPVGPEDLAPLFPMALIAQEVTADSYVPIPEEVLDVYKLWRPTPLFRAHRLEKALNTPARIYYKYGAFPRLGRTSPIPPCRRRTTTPSKAPGDHHRDWRRSVGARWPSPRPSLGWSARSGWCVPPMTRSHTGAR